MTNLHGNVHRLEVDVPIRDGINLKADVYLGAGDEPRPALLNRTPYGRRCQVAEVYAHPAWYAARGFAVACQDTRGRGDSGGDFHPFEFESQDGADTIEWLAAQPWCDGTVGTYGFSYSGAVQLAAATSAPSQLRAMAPAMTAANFGTGWVYRNGALNLAWVLSWTAELGRETALRAGDLDAGAAFDELLANSSKWFATLPLRSAFPDQLLRHVPYFIDWLTHTDSDDYWSDRSLLTGLSAVSTPGLWIAGWYDVFLEATLEAREHVLATSPAPQPLVIGPWWHTPWGRLIGEADFGPEASNPIDELQLGFFSRWLQGADGESPTEPGVRLFVMGDDAWQSFETWPPPTLGKTLYLRSDGRANSLNGTGRLASTPPAGAESADRIASDPKLPVASLGGRSCCYPEICPMGPADQRSQESRNDVLVYDSDVLEADLLVIGYPKLTLSVAADEPRTDVIVKLVDVDPAGRAVNVSDGNVRLDLTAASAPLEVTVPMSPTAVRFRRGHKVRLDIAETSFPMFDRNPHTHVSPSQATNADLAPVTLGVFHDVAHVSTLELPIFEKPIGA